MILVNKFIYKKNWNKHCLFQYGARDRIILAQKGLVEPLCVFHCCLFVAYELILIWFSTSSAFACLIDSPSLCKMLSILEMLSLI